MLRSLVIPEFSTANEFSTPNPSQPTTCPKTRGKGGKERGKPPLLESNTAEQFKQIQRRFRKPGEMHPNHPNLKRICMRFHTSFIAERSGTWNPTPFHGSVAFEVRTARRRQPPGRSLVLLPTSQMARTLAGCALAVPGRTTSGSALAWVRIVCLQMCALARQTWLARGARCVQVFATCAVLFPYPVCALELKA